MAVQAERNRATATAPTRARQVEGAAVGFFMASGAAGLIYQVVWSRELVLVFGNTTQAISTIVTAFMIGLGLGSWAGGRLTSRRWNGLRLYGILELLIALFAVTLPLGFHAIGEVYRATYNSLGHTEITLVRLALALAAAPAGRRPGGRLDHASQESVEDNREKEREENGEGSGNAKENHR